MKLSETERMILKRACECEEDKGFMWAGTYYHWRDVMSLVRKGLVRTIDAPIRVVIATPAGRARLAP